MEFNLVLYLFIDEDSPEPSIGTFDRVRRKDGRTGGPSFINVLNDVE